jgi:class 3 adenylate cyclase
MRRRIPIPAYLTALLAFVALVIGLSTTALFFTRMKEAALSEAYLAFDRTATVIAQQLIQSRLEVAFALAAAGSSPLARARGLENQVRAKEPLERILASSPLVTTAFVGYANGNFLLFRHAERIDDLPPGVRAGRDYVLRGTETTRNGRRGRYWFFDREMRPLGERAEPGFQFDPHSRSWFAARAAEVNVTAPYLFFGTNHLGISISEPSADGAVFGVDVDLAGISQSLARLQPTPSALAAVVSPAGVVLAFSNAKRLEQINAKKRAGPAVIGELGAQPLTVAFASSMRPGMDISGTYRDAGGRTWVYRVDHGATTARTPLTSIDPASGRRAPSAILVLALPEDELIAAALRVRNQALLLCIVLIIAMVPLAYLLSQVVSRPIRVLRRDALALRNLDFTEQASRRSPIAEIDEFSETFGAMRTHIREHNEAATHFVPREFLQLLGRPDLRSLELGDHQERVMTMLFADIRSFTTLSGSMTPAETFRFVNSYLTRIGPVIREHRGFIDKYIGDAIFALFQGAAGDGLEAAIAMQRLIVPYNEGRLRAGYRPITIGIGVHRGNLMLGTIGEAQRFETTVISDAVNIAARMEGLTKVFGALILASGDELREVDRSRYSLRDLGEVQAKGAVHSVGVYEVFDADPPELHEQKLRTLPLFEAGRRAYIRGDFTEAYELFAEICSDGSDRAATYFRDRAAVMAKAVGTIDWDGTEHMEIK